MSGPNSITLHSAQIMLINERECEYLYGYAAAVRSQSVRSRELDSRALAVFLFLARAGTKRKSQNSTMYERTGDEGVACRMYVCRCERARANRVLYAYYVHHKRAPFI